MIGNKIANTVGKSYNIKTTKALNNSQQNNSETVTNKHDKEILEEGCISPEERQKIIDDLRLI